MLRGDHPSKRAESEVRSWQEQTSGPPWKVRTRELKFAQWKIFPPNQFYFSRRRRVSSVSSDLSHHYLGPPPAYQLKIVFCLSPLSLSSREILGALLSWQRNLSLITRARRMSKQTILVPFGFSSLASLVWFNLVPFVFVTLGNCYWSELTGTFGIISSPSFSLVSVFFFRIKLNE